MNPHALKATRQGATSPEVAQINTVKQTYSEALPIRDRLLVHAAGGPAKVCQNARQRVGVNARAAICADRNPSRLADPHLF